MLPGNHKDEWPLIHFVPTLTPFLLSCLYIDLSSFCLSLFSFYFYLPSSSRLFFKPFEAGALLCLASNLLFPEPSTEVKRVTLSRQTSAMHNRPFSWSVPRHLQDFRNKKLFQDVKFIFPSIRNTLDLKLERLFLKNGILLYHPMLVLIQKNVFAKHGRDS